MSQENGLVQWLASARDGSLSLQGLLQRLAATAPTYFTLCHPPEDSAQGLRPALVLNQKGGQLAVLFTERDRARALYPDRADALVEYSATEALQGILRAGIGGAMIDPGHGDLALEYAAVRWLFREYAFAELKRAGGAWAPVRDSRLLLLEVMPRVYTIPVYLGKADAAASAAQMDAEVEWHDWSSIQARSHHAGTDGVFLQCNYAEEMALTRGMVSRIAGDSRPDPLEDLESAIGAGPSSLPVADIMPRLLALDRVWVLCDPTGAQVTVGDTFDLFTNLAAVDRFRRSLDHSVVALQASPQFVKAAIFFDNVARRELRCAINRGSDRSWVDTGLCLPAVLRLDPGAVSVASVTS